MNLSVDRQPLLPLLMCGLGLVALCVSSLAFARGTTERERTMSRYANCEWTDAMGKELYECVKRNNGFNTHWCFDETVQMNCKAEPDKEEATAGKAAAEKAAMEKAAAEKAAAEKAAAEMAAADSQKKAQEDARKRAARQGEENLRGTIEREQTMLKYKDCEWTDEMGKYTYECVKRNNGFNTHWCYDEALQLHCPKPEEEPAS